MLAIDPKNWAPWIATSVRMFPASDETWPCMRRIDDAAWFTPVTSPLELAVKTAETLPI